jgi:Alanine racemase, N-terminal domain
VTGAFGRSCRGLGDFQRPPLETLPEAVARNVAIARARTRARIMAVVKADGYGHAARTVALPSAPSSVDGLVSAGLRSIWLGHPSAKAQTARSGARLPSPDRGESPDDRQTRVS